MGAPMPPGLRPHRDRPPEWAIPCPVVTCRALAGRCCTTPRGRRLTTGSHPSRYDTWLIQQHAA